MSIFISYRRASAGADARNIALALERRYGKSSVFFDTETLEHGKNFRTSLSSALHSANVLLVIVDPSWNPDQTKRDDRLFRPDDYVRFEIETFISKGALIIPVFVGQGSAMPAHSALPESIMDFSYLHGVRISFENFTNDIDRLYSILDEGTGTNRKRYRRRLSVAGLISLFAIVLFSAILSSIHRVNTLSRSEAAALLPGSNFQECGYCPQMVVLPSGDFDMGAPEGELGTWPDGRERPIRHVRIPARFAMSVSQITVAEFGEFARDTGFEPNSGCRSHAGGGPQGLRNTRWDSPGFPQSDAHPVVCVSWEDAREYTRWLSAKTGAEYRLPSEAEWEFGARSGGTGIFSFGDDWALLCEHGNIYDRTIAQVGGGQSFCTDGYIFTAPTKSFAPSQFGLFDMVGNVWEWTLDCWYGDHSSNSLNGLPVVTETCDSRTQKGGDWIGLPQYARPASRHFYGATARGDNVGFRVVRTLR